ncbi:putative exported protein [Pectobacterium atrosepticum SCRI1043]|uniref:Exported protein n=1 Tax=Pectobacterium atrosepticum (strain SCRI 1043 / ATCC BAA-672) TaxID=218491 RepID=Q6D5W2_PECAS|nr:C40 family peptidase [Pectobacterium atrosepticum]GKV83975.1 hydrolase [Pectobacterium carotovorum subsp. carotovorum]AIA70766.1 endopeptidase [Pectobacterium atrosepticum]AIK14463.1 putative exported protein [Pectobacterium atrosepticum]ATY91214.1 peptidoglycan endopeptidase [Pectobacterium atrosepticum]KFX17851.1 endopeptidase [Pectobacterium atrosepticum]
MRLFITLFILFFSNLSLNLVQAAPHTPHSAPKKSAVEETNKKSRQTKGNAKSPTPIKSKKPEPTAVSNKTKPRTANKSTEKKPSRTQSSTPALVKKNLKKLKSEEEKQTTAQVRVKTGLKKTALKGKLDKNPSPTEKGMTLSAAHKKRYQHAKTTAMNKLMSQIGKPYHWGGSSPFTGFDCSGLVYYAYKDVVKIQIPRTANEMYHLRDAAPIKKSELESGDLVFFRINNRGAADHVGVYLGEGKFIQSPRTGSDIRISKLSEDYWQEHYVGARRVVTPQTIR